jgi:uncharacterized protein YvpB
MTAISPLRIEKNSMKVSIFKTRRFLMKLKVMPTILAMGTLITGAYTGVQNINLLPTSIEAIYETIEPKQEESLVSYVAIADLNSSEELKGEKEDLGQSEQVILDGVPHIQQLPELARGCEVTSLAMMLQFAGVSVDKMTLAEEIDTVSFRDQYGYHGNPNEGFVGDIYSFDTPGYGVYHGPIAALAENYLPGRIIDLTGESIDSVYSMVQSGSPVWVIVNSRFEFLTEEEFEVWDTQSGEVQITYREHSVVVVGYDETSVYINDPLSEQGYTSVPKASFEAAWDQMGQQAISYLAN